MEKLEGVPQEGRYHSKGNFDVRFIRAVLQEISEGLPIRAAASKYELNKKSIYRWIRDYSAEGHAILKRIVLSDGEKRSIVRAISTGRLTLKEASASYMITERAIQNWRKKYAAENEELSFSNKENLSKQKGKQKSSDDNEQVRELRQQLADAQLKIAALNTLIDVAEEHLKINIRKKPGAKQS